MKKTDFRIGNLLYYEGEVLPISSINGDSTVRLKKGNDSVGCFHISRLKPIEITDNHYRKIEKSLIDAGFGYGFKDNKITIYLSDRWELEFNYIHELQNFYHSIEKKELKINMV